MQMKYMLSCLFVLFKGFFLSKFFYLAVVEVEGSQGSQGSQEGEERI